MILRQRRPRHSKLRVVALLAAGLLAGPSMAGAADLTLHETGSTLLYPLFQALDPHHAQLPTPGRS